MKLIGPFKQLLTLDHLPLKGALSDKQMEIIEDGGIWIEKGKIIGLGIFSDMESKALKQRIDIEKIDVPLVAFPGMIDCHTHICWAGSRAQDYASRLSGKSYLEIAQSGGGIWDTVLKTRHATVDELKNRTIEHANQQLKDGITTIELKSGYGLTVDAELKMLQAIANASKQTNADLIPTCLAAHICPKDFNGTSKEYLSDVLCNLLPQVKNQNLSKRVDIFIESSAFSVEEAMFYLSEAKKMGFDLVVHGDQFNSGGSKVAVNVVACSVDHLEASGNPEVKMIASSNVVAVVLPGASIGLGESFAPARKLLDAGATVAIASDWNPGSAPMGDLLVQTSIMGAYEKLTMTEMLAAITFRAANALRLNDRGVLKEGNIADIVAFECSDYCEIFYRQGRLKPIFVWKNGTVVS